MYCRRSDPLKMDVNQTYFYDQSKPRSQRDPLVSFISMAARFGDVETLQKLLQEAQTEDENFLTSPTIGLALKRATQSGQIDVIQCLLAAGADINTKFKGATALHEAVKVNNLQVLHFLLALDSLHRDSISLAQKTALMEAACRGRVQCLLALLEAGCRVYTSNARGLTALHYCLLPSIGTIDADDTIACLELLYNAGANVDVQDNYGNTPLHVAIATENFEALLWFLNQNCRLDLEARPPDLAPGVFSCLQGRLSLTPLLLALHFSNRRVVQLLVACGCKYYSLSWVLPYIQQYTLLHEFMLEALSKPHSLQASCRQLVRKCIGRDIKKKVEQLTYLPQSIRRYILCCDELNIV